MNLNAGGIVGGLLGAGLVLVVGWGVFQESESQRGIGKLVVMGVIGGAVAGNFLWDKILGSKS